MLELEAVVRNSSPTSTERHGDLYREILDLTKHDEDHRPCGFFEVRSDRKVKRITVYPGMRCRRHPSTVLTGEVIVIHER